MGSLKYADDDVLAFFLYNDFVSHNLYIILDVNLTVVETFSDIITLDIRLKSASIFNIVKFGLSKTDPLFL